MTTSNRSLDWGRKVISASVMSMVLFLPGSVWAETEAGLKAAFVYNFTKYVTWPAAAEQQGGSLLLCVVGQPASKALLSLTGRKVRAFHLDVAELKSDADLSHCHILYVNSRKSILDLDAFSHRAMLTIGFSETFLSQGGMIQLYQEKRRLRFNINNGRAKQAQLKISAKLLLLAGKVLR